MTHETFRVNYGLTWIEESCVEIVVSIFAVIVALSCLVTLFASGFKDLRKSGAKPPLRKSADSDRRDD